MCGIWLLVNSYLRNDYTKCIAHIYHPCKTHFHSPWKICPLPPEHWQAWLLLLLQDTWHSDLWIIIYSSDWSDLADSVLKLVDTKAIPNETARWPFHKVSFSGNLIVVWMKKMRLVSTSFVIPSSILMLIRGDIKEIIKEITQIHVSSIEWLSG